MDLSILILGAIGFAGYKLNDKKQPREKKKVRKDVSPHDIPSSKNIYRSTYSKQMDSKDKTIANRRYKKAENPEKTGIIPPLYNTYCKWDCDDNFGQKAMNREDTFLPSVKPIKDNEKRNQQIMSGPMFKENEFGNVKRVQYDDLNKDEPGAIQTECFQNISSLSGEYTDMHHNNMVPFFGSSVKQNTHLNANESILSNLTGDDMTTRIKKSEVPKMFENQRENVYGSVQYTDKVSNNRFVVSDLKTSILPTAQIREQPIPEEYLRPSYKNVNQLRTVNNPKNEYLNRVIKGNRYVSKSGKIGVVQKNRPETFYNNTSDRYFRTGGEVVAPTYRSDVNLKCTPRADVAEKCLNVNPAYNASLNKGVPNNYKLVSDSFNEQMYNTTMVHDDKKHTYKQDWVRNAVGDTEYNINNIHSYSAPEQERETTNRMDFLPASDVNRGYHQALDKELRVTNKQNNLYSHLGGASGEVSKTTDRVAAKNYTYNKQAINNSYYKGVASRTNLGEYNTAQYKNVKINSNRQNVMDKRGYTAGPQKENVALGVESVNANLKDDTRGKSKYDYNANVNKVFQDTPTSSILGKNTSNTICEKDITERINPELLDAFRKNPYTQSLSSI